MENVKLPFVIVLAANLLLCGCADSNRNGRPEAKPTDTQTERLAAPTNIEGRWTDNSATNIEVIQVQEEFGDTDKYLWVTATSTNGGFSVELPGKFTELTIDGESSNGHPMQTHMIIHSARQGRSYAAGTKFSVTAFEGGNASRDPNIFRNFTDDLSKHARVIEQRDITVLDSVGIDVIADSPEARLFARLFSDVDTKYLMMVENPKKESEVTRETVKRYFESFNFVK